MTFPVTETPGAWTVWVMDDTNVASLRQVAWADRRRAAEGLFEIVVAEREPGTIVQLYRPSRGEDRGHVGEQVAALGP